MDNPDENSLQPGVEIPIQQATWRDIWKLRRLEKLCFSPEDAWPLIELLRVLTFPDTVRLKIDQGDEMIAFLAGEIRRKEGVGWIITIGVDPTWHGRGLGKRLLAEGEKALDMQRVRLTVRASNESAIRMYLKSGYRKIGHVEKYYFGGEDGLVFEKLIR